MFTNKSLIKDLSAHQSVSEAVGMDSRQAFRAGLIPRGNRLLLSQIPSMSWYVVQSAHTQSLNLSQDEKPNQA